MIVFFDRTPDGVLAMLKVYRLILLSGGMRSSGMAKDIDGADSFVIVAHAWLVILISPARQGRRDEALLDRHSARVRVWLKKAEERC